MMNKTVFVTGGTSDIGSAVILALENKGWQVLAPRREDLDLSNLGHVKDYIRNLSEEKIDAYIHVAGVWHDSTGPLADKEYRQFSPEQIASTMNVGVTSAMLLLNGLEISKDAIIIGISGTFNDGANGWVPYFTSKRALEDFIVGYADEYRDQRVYGISPADTATKPFKEHYSEHIKDAQSPDEIARLALELIEDNSEYKSGSILELRDGKVSEGYHS